MRSWWRTTRLALLIATILLRNSASQHPHKANTSAASVGRHRKSGSSAGGSTGSSRSSSSGSSSSSSSSRSRTRERAVSSAAAVAASLAGTGMAVPASAGRQPSPPSFAQGRRRPDDGAASVALSKPDLLARVHELHGLLNDKEIALEDEKARCTAIVRSTKTEQLRLASRQVQELSNYSHSLQAEVEAKAAEEKRKLVREMELLEAEKLHQAKRQQECEVRTERWRNVSMEQKVVCAQQHEALDKNVNVAKALTESWQATAEQMLLFVRAVGPAAKQIRQRNAHDSLGQGPSSVQSEFLAEFFRVVDQRLAYERGEQQLADVQKEQREIAALKLHTERLEHSRLDLDSLLK